MILRSLKKGLAVIGLGLLLIGSGLYSVDAQEQPAGHPVATKATESEVDEKMLDDLQKTACRNCRKACCRSQKKVACDKKSCKCGKMKERVN